MMLRDHIYLNVRPHDFMGECDCTCHGWSNPGDLLLASMSGNDPRQQSCEHCQPDIQEDENSTEILKKRLARGDISEDEYWRKKDILDS